eukprot:scaffold15318_cov125-Isochrysis_galbana.AAC.6
MSRAWDAACRRQPPPSSSSWSARDRPWPRRRRPTRPWPDPRQVVRRPARATHAAPRRAFRQRVHLCRSPDDATAPSQERSAVRRPARARKPHIGP